MGIIILIIGIVLTGILIYNIYKTRRIVKIVRKSNAIVYGGRGKGKDLFFQRLVNSYKKDKKIFANVDYGRNQLVSISELDIVPNTYKNFINEQYHIIQKKDIFENSSLYISDCGVYLPNFYDSELKKIYPSLPAYFALSRHLYNQNIIINIQDVDRCWKLLEEQQQDCFVRCRGAVNLGVGMLVYATYYDNVSSALENRRPLKTRGLKNDVNRANIETVKAQYGEVTDFVFWLPKWKIKYDSRAFHKKIFGMSVDDYNKSKNKIVLKGGNK